MIKVITSRKIVDLHPHTAKLCEAFLIACRHHEIDVIITCTYRDDEAQAELYAQGRTKPGRIVTYAKPGQSMHNKRLAFDVVPLRAGKAVWGTQGEDLALWQKIGALGEAQGLSWGGRWNHPDMPHFQDDTVKDLSDIEFLKEQAL